MIAAALLGLVVGFGLGGLFMLWRLTPYLGQPMRIQPRARDTTPDPDIEPRLHGRWERRLSTGGIPFSVWTPDSDYGDAE